MVWRELEEASERARLADEAEAAGINLGGFCFRMRAVRAGAR
jgi:hypothetical protein